MNSPLSYLGGKSRLVSRIVPMIGDHECYCEPFCGAAWILFSKDPAASKVEIINDADGELITFWRVIQNHLEEFLRFYRFAVVSRQIYDLQKRSDPTTLTDVQRAVRYYYLQKLAFAGITGNRHFAAGPKGGPRLNLLNIEDTLLDVHWRLAKVVIEHLDACECLRRYDRPETFFFIDPPYHKVHGYAVPWGEDDFARLTEVLRSIQGRFVLTMNDTTDTRRMFKDWSVKTVELRYSAANANQSAASRAEVRRELIVTNK